MWSPGRFAFALLAGTFAASGVACLAQTGPGSLSGPMPGAVVGSPVPFENPVWLAYGPLGVLFGVFVYFIVWYGPGVVTSYTRALDAATDHLPRMAKAMERIADGATPPRPLEFRPGVRHD